MKQIPSEWPMKMNYCNTHDMSFWEGSLCPKCTSESIGHTKNGNPSALKVQVSGSHYKDMKIQPIEFIHANNLGFIEGNVVKYVSRWKQKNGVDDLKKARHYLDLLIELGGDESRG